MTCKNECENCTDPVKKVVKGSVTTFYVNGTKCNLVQELSVPENAGYRRFLYPDGVVKDVYGCGMAVKWLPETDKVYGDGIGLVQELEVVALAVLGGVV